MPMHHLLLKEILIIPDGSGKTKDHLLLVLILLLFTNLEAIRTRGDTGCKKRTYKFFTILQDE